MSEDNEAFVPEVSDEEKKRRQKSGILATVQSLIEAREQAWTEEMAGVLEEAKKPVRDSVPERYGNAEHRGVTKLTSPTEAIYRGMPEEVRAIRNPDSDHWMAEEIRAIAYNDRARLFQAKAKLGAMFERATTTEGLAAGTTGAFSTGTGGTLISRPVEQLVLIAKEKVSKMPRFASGITMTKQQHTIPTGAAMTAYQTLEGGTTTQGEPTYAGCALRAVKGAARGIVTLEMLDDADANIVSFMTTRAGMALGALQELQFWQTGNGTEPNISAFAAGTAATTTTAAALDYTSVLSTYYALSEAYLESAAWYAEKSVLQAMAMVRDGNGRAFYQGLTERPGAIDDTTRAVGTILGHPVYRVAATAGTIHFGDMNALYLVGFRQGLRARMSEHVGFATGTVQFVWEQRYDGNNVDVAAVLSITGITSANSL